MTFFGVLFIVLGGGMALQAARSELRAGGWFLAPLALYLWHTAMVVAYWIFAQHSVVDATSYFEAGPYYETPAIGTDMIYWFTGVLRFVCPGMSFLDGFLFYGLFGYLGLICFLRSASTLAGPVYRNLRLWAVGLAFLPGLSFWTGAIGKDAPMFLAVQLVIFAACRPSRRWGYVLLGFALAFVIRPHIALLLGISGAAAFVFSSRLPGHLRAFGMVAVALLGAFAVPFVADYLSIKSFDGEYISDYVFARQHDLGIGGSAVDLQNYSFPMKLFTYLYRPTLLEANSLMALLAAVENTLQLAITGVLAVRISRRISILRSNPALMFCVCFFILGASACAMLTANLGMAVRQKEQFMPCLFLLLIACLAADKRLSIARAVQQWLASRVAAANSLPTAVSPPTGVSP